MKLMVADLKGLVLLAYPLATFGGWLQLKSVWASTFMVTNKTPLFTDMHFFMAAAVIYPALLTAFFRLDGRNPLFPLITVGAISAMFGLLVYPLFMVLGSAVGLPLASPLTHIVMLVLEIVAAFVFLFNMTETDLHELPNGLIFGSLLALEISAMAYVCYYYQLPQQVMAKLTGH